ncbi:MAG: MmcQ/YjbR family DNA-binding protein [Bacillota bacterium]|nr:MmcQ/YjbR family DNA-binding protein [Bacillota bacterium]
MDVLKYCLSKKGAYEDYPFGPEPVTIKIGSKMFALISNRSDKLYLSLKCDPFMAQSLREQYSNISPGYHLNKQHWNTIIVDESIPEHEVIWMIDHSYELVFKSLSKTEKERIV